MKDSLKKIYNRYIFYKINQVHLKCHFMPQIDIRLDLVMMLQEDDKFYNSVNTALYTCSSKQALQYYNGASQNRGRGVLKIPLLTRCT